MLEVRVMDSAKLYDRLTATRSLDLGKRSLSDGIVKSVNSRYDNFQDLYILTGTISTNISDIDLSPIGERLDERFCVTDYNSEVLRMTYRDKRAFIEKRGAKKDEIFISSNSARLEVSLGEFEECLRDYALILQACLEVIYGAKGIASPDIEYVFGRDPTGGLLDSGQLHLEHPTSPTKYEIGNPNINWSHIGGLFRIKDELSMAIWEYLHPEERRSFGDTARHGYLLSGKEGCGKDLLAKAVATELRNRLGVSLQIYFPSYAEVTSPLRGGEAIQVHNLFAHAIYELKRDYWVMLFLNEFQTESQRSLRDPSLTEAVNQLLIEIDKFNQYEKGFLIAATAQPLNMLDQQIIRQGRFKTLRINTPDLDETIDILKAVVRIRRENAREEGNRQLFDPTGLRYGRIAKRILGYTGAQIDDLVQNAVDKKKKIKRETGDFVPITTMDILAYIGR